MNSPKLTRPPRLAMKLLAWYASSVSLEDLQGDLEENFVRNAAKVSLFRARWIFWRQTVSLLLSYSVRKRKRDASYHAESSPLFSPGMLRNYFITASRSLARHRLFTALNVLGLATGMSIGLLFIAMVSFLSTYDDFHEKGSRIYRVISKVQDGVETEVHATALPEIADKVRAWNDVEEVVRIDRNFSGLAKHAETEVPLQGLLVDPSFFKIFSFEFKKGNPATALSKPTALLLTESGAEKLFGKKDPFGQLVTVGSQGPFEVTGVLADPPRNSHIKFEMIGSFELADAAPLTADTDQPETAWDKLDGKYMYLLASPNTMEAQLKEMGSRMGPDISFPNFTIDIRIQALGDIVLGESLFNEIGPTWDLPSLSIFLLLTLLILLPACFNYATIAISRALKRMKEIGLRKTVGGVAGQIFIQFVLETVLLSLLAVFLAFYLFVLIRDEFIGLLVGGSESVSLQPDFTTLIYFGLFALFFGIAAGAVPAIYFARLSPLKALKGKAASQPRGLGIRKVLLVGQFGLSLAFIMGVFITLSQYRQSLSYDLGFRQENILDVELQGVDPYVFRAEFGRLASVSELSMSAGVMGVEALPQTWVKNAVSGDSSEVFSFSVSDNYIRNQELELLAGRDFHPDDPREKMVIVNESFVSKFGLARPEDAPGFQFTATDGVEKTVIGVVSDFHYAGLREPIRPMFFYAGPASWHVANLRIQSEDIFSAITEMEHVYKTLEPELPFTAKFRDDAIEEAFSYHMALVKICGFLGLLALTISCLGLLGMVVFHVENRVREIGIRKVMGATSRGIAFTLSWDFARLMLMAVPLFVPLTYFFFDLVYLRDQYYKIPIGLTEIAASILLLFTLGLATVLSQTLRAARANPVDALRAE